MPHRIIIKLLTSIIGVEFLLLQFHFLLIKSAKSLYCFKVGEVWG